MGSSRRQKRAMLLRGGSHDPARPNAGRAAGLARQEGLAAGFAAARGRLVEAEDLGRRA